jgi:hypothetical protein
MTMGNISNKNNNNKGLNRSTGGKPPEKPMTKKKIKKNKKKNCSRMKKRKAHSTFDRFRTTAPRQRDCSSGIYQKRERRPKTRPRPGSGTAQKTTPRKAKEATCLQEEDGNRSGKKNKEKKNQEKRKEKKKYEQAIFETRVTVQILRCEPRRSAESQN